VSASVSEPDRAKHQQDEQALKAAIDKIELSPDAGEYLNGRYLAYTS
jgi:hypothetical protein